MRRPVTVPDGHLEFVLVTNLGVPSDRDPWLASLLANDIAVESTTDLPRIGRARDAHGFDIGFVPLASLGDRALEPQAVSGTFRPFDAADPGVRP